MKHTTSYPCPKCIWEGKETDLKRFSFEEKRTLRVTKYNLEIAVLMRRMYG